MDRTGAKIDTPLTQPIAECSHENLAVSGHLILADDSDYPVVVLPPIRLAELRAQVERRSGCRSMISTPTIYVTVRKAGRLCLAKGGT
jgi:hypothetical protein